MSDQSTSPTRPSRFIEGEPATRPDILNRTQTSNELFFKTLSEMDHHPSSSPINRTHRNSNSSTTSHQSVTSDAGAAVLPKEKEGRRSKNFTGRSSLDEGEGAREKTTEKIKGRLRALTGGSDRKMKAVPYAGT